MAVGMHAVQTKPRQINIQKDLFAMAHRSDPQCGSFHSAVLADCLHIVEWLRGLSLCVKTEFMNWTMKIHHQWLKHIAITPGAKFAVLFYLFLNIHSCPCGILIVSNFTIFPSKVNGVYPETLFKCYVLWEVVFFVITWLKNGKLVLCVRACFECVFDVSV